MLIDATPPRCRWLTLAALLCLAASSGCTSVIGSAYLREAWLDGLEDAADSRARSSRGEKSATDAADDAGTADRAAEPLPDNDAAFGSSDAGDSVTEASASSPATIAEAVEEADKRLERSGGLNEAARTTLIAMLETTPRQDWPVVVEEFATALAASQKAAAPPAIAAPAPSVEPVAPLPPAEVAEAPVAQPAPVAPPEIGRAHV